MAPMTPFFNFNPSLQLLQNSTGDEGATGTVAVATAARKRQEKKATGDLKTLKISNNFGLAGCENPLGQPSLMVG